MTQGTAWPVLAAVPLPFPGDKFPDPGPGNRSRAGFQNRHDPGTGRRSRHGRHRTVGRSVKRKRAIFTCGEVRSLVVGAAPVNDSGPLFSSVRFFKLGQYVSLSQFRVKIN